ncbi:MAG: hypothetical protein KKA79_07710 [Nanoarchaeota archaeon]|nr:hypothetical protein [Nanoarchaeota archaeon]MCG2718796.1 hypothetical protein [Nanoarchaeota archaeon]
MKLRRGIRPKNSAINFAIEFTISWLLFILLAYAIHEYSHLLTLKMLGGDGAITEWNLMTPISMPPVEHGAALIALAGGWGVMIVYSILLLIIEEMQERCALLIIAIQQGIYGVGEMMAHMGIGVNMFVVAFLGYVIGIIPVLFLVYKIFGHKRRIVKKISYVYQ